jgi:hypothetical protein
LLRTRIWLRAALRGFAAVAVTTTGMSNGVAAAQSKPEAYTGTGLPVTGSRVPDLPEEFSQDQTQKILRHYAGCVVDKQRSLASEYVLDRTTLRFDDRYASLADGDCLFEATGSYFADVGLSLGEDTMRFALAEALLRNELRTIDPAGLPQAPRLRMPLLFTADYLPKTDRQYRVSEIKALDARKQKDLTTLLLYRFGECEVRTNPHAARALLQAEPNSDREATAVQSLLPVLGSCLEKGSEVKLDRSRLRGAIALSYYSLAHVPLTRQRGDRTSQR